MVNIIIMRLMATKISCKTFIKAIRRKLIKMRYRTTQHAVMISLYWGKFVWHFDWRSVYSLQAFNP